MHEPFLEKILEGRARQFRKPSRYGIHRKLEKYEDDDADGACYKAVQVLIDSVVYDVAEKDRIQNTARAVQALDDGQCEDVEFLSSRDFIKPFCCAVVHLFNSFLKNLLVLEIITRTG